MKIYNRVMDILKKELTKEEWIELAEALDNGQDFLDPVNEYVETIAPEIFAEDVLIPTKALCFSCEKRLIVYVTGLCEQCHQDAMGGDDDSKVH